MANGRLFSAQEVLSSIDQAVRKEFDSNRRILSFDEYLALVGETPRLQTRGSAAYLADMMDHFGREPVAKPETTGPVPLNRYRLFDLPIDSMASKVVGQEAVQNQIYRALRTFSRQGINNKLILLHGPNGSAKSSIAHALMGGMERYSRESLEGATYTFNWIFPVDRVHQRRDRDQYARVLRQTGQQHRKASPSFRTKRSPRAFPAICATIRCS